MAPEGPPPKITAKEFRGKGRKAAMKRSENSQGGEPLPIAVGGTLNPRWVEWLMGFPDGWTDLEG